MGCSSSVPSKTGMIIEVGAAPVDNSIPNYTDEQLQEQKEKLKNQKYQIKLAVQMARMKTEEEVNRVQYNARISAENVNKAMKIQQITAAVARMVEAAESIPDYQYVEANDSVCSKDEIDYQDPVMSAFQHVVKGTEQIITRDSMIAARNIKESAAVDQPIAVSAPEPPIQTVHKPSIYPEIPEATSNVVVPESAPEPTDVPASVPVKQEIKLDVNIHVTGAESHGISVEKKEKKLIFEEDDEYEGSGILEYKSDPDEVKKPKETIYALSKTISEDDVEKKFMEQIDKMSINKTFEIECKSHFIDYLKKIQPGFKISYVDCNAISIAFYLTKVPVELGDSFDEFLSSMKLVFDNCNYKKMEMINDINRKQYKFVIKPKGTTEIVDFVVLEKAIIEQTKKFDFIYVFHCAKSFGCITVSHNEFAPYNSKTQVECVDIFEKPIKKEIITKLFENSVVTACVNEDDSSVFNIYLTKMRGFKRTC